MKYSLFFTCLIYVLLDGTEVTGLSIFPKKTSFSLLGSSTKTATTTTTKKPLQTATNGLVSSLTNLLGLGATTTTPTPTTAKPISKIISDVKSIQNKLNDLSQTESSDSSTTETPHVILPDIPKVTSTSPSTSDISTHVLPVQNTDDYSKPILLESPLAVPNIEVEQTPKLNDLLNNEKQNAEERQTAGEDVVDRGLEELNLEQTMGKSEPILILDQVSSSVPEVVSEKPVEEDPLQLIKANEDSLESSSCLPSLKKQDVHLTSEDVAPLPNFTNIVGTASRPELNSVIQTDVRHGPDSLLSEVTDSESESVPEMGVTPESVTALNLENENLLCKEDPSTIQSQSEELFMVPGNTDPTKYETKTVETSELNNLQNGNTILSPSASNTQSTDSFASDQEILTKVPSVPLNVLPLEHTTQLDALPVGDTDSLNEISKVVSDIPATLPVDVANSDVKTPVSPKTPEVVSPVSLPPPVLNYVVSTEPSKENSPKMTVSIRSPETSTVGVSSSTLSALPNALPFIPGLGDLVTYALSVLSALLATIADRIGITLENLIAQISTLHPFFASLINISPGISPEIQSRFVASTAESCKLLSRFELNGIGGLAELLNFAYSFLYGLLRSLPDLLEGMPLATVLKVLPNFLGTFENILPNLSVGSTSGTLYKAVLADPVTENSNNEADSLFIYRDAPLIDIHHNEINLLKIVIS